MAELISYQLIKHATFYLFVAVISEFWLPIAIQLVPQIPF